MNYAILSAGSGWHVRDLSAPPTCSATPPTPSIFAASAPASPPGRCSAQRLRRRHRSHHAAGVARAGRFPHGRAASLAGGRACRAESAAAPSKSASISTWPPPGSKRPALPVPPTIVCQHADAALEAFATLGGDVVVKPIFGSEGRGMVRVSDVEIAWRTFRTLERLQCVLYLQQFIRPSRLGPARLRDRRQGADGDAAHGRPTAGARTSPRAVAANRPGRRPTRSDSRCGPPRPCGVPWPASICMQGRRASGTSSK